MFVAQFTAFLALASAVTIVVVAIKRHQSRDGVIRSWTDVKEAFAGETIRGYRQEAALLSEPDDLEGDLSMEDLFAEAKEGSGYIRPRDLLSPRAGRN